MPPRTKISKDMIIDAAVEVVRQGGFENVNARTVSERLHCSTQPVMYHFATIDSLKRATYARVDRLHSQYMMNIPPAQDPVLGIGLNYIRFAVEEPQLFRFLFQSGYAEENSLLEMIDSEELLPILAAMQEGAGLRMEKTKEIFLTVALFAHGYASIIANNGLEYDEALIAEHLERAWNGAFLAATQEETTSTQEENDEETV
ncbi:MAG: TetR/AcrR family transcriptional regulator [Mogibacterium sp.]|nr:TetR/AcrR family transcriptional regulator [Mogibacterium sp.]